MTKTVRGLDGKADGNIGWILVLLLVAGSSFLLGSELKQKSTADAPKVKSETPTQSVITEIGSILQNPSTGKPVASNNTASTPAISGVVSINAGSQAELETLPGIGPAYAQAIISYRTQNGPFVRIEDIQQVKGIGPKTFEKLKDKITL